jgi:glycosyltransferase involved in cell wall biosynthesis
MNRALTIGYDATPAVCQRAGIGRYARELLSALANLDSADRYRLIYCRGGGETQLIAALPRCSRFRHAPLPASDRLMNVIWQRLRLPLPIELRTGRLDVMHAPDFSLPPSLAPSIVTIHDLAFEVVPACSYPTLRAYLRQVVPRVITRACAVIAVSCTTKQDIMTYYDTPSEKIHVIYEGVPRGFQPLPPEVVNAVCQRYHLDNPFILAVSTLEPRKNYERLLDAYAVLRERGRQRGGINGLPTLVIVGRLGWLYKSIFERHRQLALGTSVRFLTDVDDADLAALYNAAELVVYPSLYEGFGLPALEALACGCPLACSGTSSLLEVVGEAAVTFDPYSLEDMVETIDALLQDEERRRMLTQRGLERAALFTWEKAAAETSALYHQIADD